MSCGVVFYQGVGSVGTLTEYANPHVLSTAKNISLCLSFIALGLSLYWFDVTTSASKSDYTTFHVFKTVCSRKTL